MQTYSYIPLYTAPAYKSSRQIFYEYGFYCFSKNALSKFKLDIINQAEYFALGEEYELKNSEKEYINISLMGKIIEIGEFILDYDENRIKDFQMVSDYSIDKDSLEQSINQQIDQYHRFYNGLIDKVTKKSWYYVYVKPEDIIIINEDILYPTKSLISFPLNLDKNNQYIPANKLVKSLKISENVYYNKEKNVLLVDGGEIVIGNSNMLYGKIIELLATSESGIVSLETLKNEVPYFSETTNDIGNLEKNFNKAKFANYLDYKIHISTNSNISKVNKEKK